MKTNDFAAIVMTLAAAVPTAAPAADEAASADKEKLMEIGKANFVTCLACHGPDGKGLAIGPTMKMAPTFEQSKFMLADPEVPIAIVLKGIVKETADYVGIMAPLEAALDDEKLAGVLTYVRNNFGNSAPAVTPEQVKEVREKYKDRKEQWKRAELEALIEATAKKKE
jgi:mono/diheme cytochrome c family protein